MLRAVALIAGATLASAGLAHEPAPTFDRIGFSVSASEEVDNDTLVANMYHQVQGQNPTIMADEVNKTMGWAVGQAKKIPGVKVQTLQYRQDPVYRNQSVSGWRVRQSLRLESRDVAKLSTLIGELQQRLSVQSVSYTISPEARKEVEDRLIDDALAQFQRRAERIAAALGRPDYRIVALDVGTASRAPPPMPMRTAAMASESSVTAPTLSPGVQTVTVNVSATVELTVQQ
jgi:predicted secreted protein